jgi:hypothetical protein
MPDFVKAVFEFKDDGMALTPYQSPDSAQDLDQKQFLKRLS